MLQFASYVCFRLRAGPADRRSYDPSVNQSNTERHEDEPANDIWRGMLDGTDPSLKKLRGGWHRLPGPPRCKVCAAPFNGVGGLVSRALQHKHSLPGNPLLCNMCFGALVKYPGGAEVDVSVLFADIRGSTGLAEKVGAARFRQLLQSYYAKATTAIEANDGIVDKLLGDGVMALFIPVIAGENHRLRAIEAGRRVIRAVETSDLPAAGVRVGVGVQSGTTFVGVLGSGDQMDFSALGDVVNTASRLGSIAGPAELLVASDVWRAAGLPIGSRRVDQIGVAGRQASLEIVTLSGAELEQVIG
jgi:adenylate cyclase